MAGSPIHVNYAGKCVKSRDRQLIKTFLHRFYTPFALVIWVIVAFDLKSCTNIPLLIALVSIIAAATNAAETYHTWLQGVYLMSSGNTPIIRIDLKTYVIVSDFFIHFVCIVLSFWWIDDFHECVPIDRHHQASAWSGTFVVAFLSHYMRHGSTNRQRQRIAANAYEHVAQLV